MFNPNAFTAPKETSVIICNSVHPVLDYITSMTAKKVQSKDERYANLFYIRTKNDKCVITYRSTDKSLQLHELTFEQFKAKVIACEDLSSPHETYTSEGKYIGNTVLSMLEELED